MTVDKERIFRFISKRRTAFVASVNGQGCPVVRAMLAPRKIDGNDVYFSTNTSSRKVKQFIENPKACIYFYKRGWFRYEGLAVIGEMEVCTDRATKQMIWRLGDRMYYKQGVDDPDYCVLKFRGRQAEYYSNLKTETIDL